MFAQITLVSVVVLGTLSGQSKAPEKTPQFADYPVSSIFRGVPVAPKFSTPGQRRFRAMIRQGARKGVNFAGHYAVAEWGCGASCVQVAVVDLQSGNVYDGPFGILPKGYISYIENLQNDRNGGIFYRRDSELFIARGCPNDKPCGTYYYRWTGSEFSLLR